MVRPGEPRPAQFEGCGARTAGSNTRDIGRADARAVAERGQILAVVL